MLPYPSFNIPVDNSHRMRDILAAIRYPLDIDTPFKLIEPYLSTIAEFSLPASDNQRQSPTIPEHMRRYLKVSSSRAEYLFGFGKSSSDRGMAEFTYLMVMLTSELFRCPLVSTDKDFFTVCGGVPTFGIESGRLIGLSDYKMDVPHRNWFNQGLTPRIIRHPAVLSLYDRSERLGEYEAMYALQASVWAMSGSNVTIPSILEEAYPKNGRKQGMVLQPKKAAKAKAEAVMSQDLYLQCINLIRHGSNPRLDLFYILVPWFVSVRQYRTDFADTRLTGKPSSHLIQKMIESLDKLYTGP
jgi:hypothetical protein